MESSRSPKIYYYPHSMKGDVEHGYCFSIRTTFMTPSSYLPVSDQLFPRTNRAALRRPTWTWTTCEVFRYVSVYVPRQPFKAFCYDLRGNCSPDKGSACNGSTGTQVDRCPHSLFDHWSKTRSRNTVWITVRGFRPFLQVLATEIYEYLETFAFKNPRMHSSALCKATKNVRLPFFPLKAPRCIF